MVVQVLLSLVVPMSVFVVLRVLFSPQSVPVNSGPRRGIQRFISGKTVCEA